MRNKGIAIELTALLDVIFIMLFWTMMNMQEETENIRTDAESQISQAEQQVENYRQILEDKQLEFDNQKAELEKELQKALKEAENPDKIAKDNQNALNKYAEGVVITLNLKYDSVGKLFISDNQGELSKTLIDNQKNIEECIIDSLEKSELAEDDIIMCAFIYDGSRALYKDVQTVSSAVEEVSETYERLYCTYINIS